MRSWYANEGDESRPATTADWMDNIKRGGLGVGGKGWVGVSGAAP